MEDEAEYRALRRGWCLGSPEFKAELKDGVCEQLSHMDRSSIVGKPRRVVAWRGIFGIALFILFLSNNISRRSLMVVWMQFFSIRMKNSELFSWINNEGEIR